MIDCILYYADRIKIRANIKVTAKLTGYSEEAITFAFKRRAERIKSVRDAIEKTAAEEDRCEAKNNSVKS